MVSLAMPELPLQMKSHACSEISESLGLSHAEVDDVVEQAKHGQQNANLSTRRMRLLDALQQHAWVACDFEGEVVRAAPRSGFQLVCHGLASWQGLAYQR